MVYFLFGYSFLDNTVLILTITGGVIGGLIVLIIVITITVALLVMLKLALLIVFPIPIHPFNSSICPFDKPLIHPMTHSSIHFSVAVLVQS